MTQTLIEEGKNIRRLAAFKMHKDGGDNLRMLVADKIGSGLRLHKVERLDTAGGIARLENIFQQAGCTLFAKRFHQHRTQVVVGVDIERGELLCLLLKLLQNVGQLLVGDLAHAGHRGTQVLNLALGEVLEHLCRAVFANGHQQDDALFRSGKVTHSLHHSSTGG